METKKIVLSVIMVVVSITTFAKWDGTSTPWTQGSGTQQQPYLIETSGQLAFLSDMVLGGTTYSNKYFKLSNNISLSNVKWTPIGDASNTFQGHFDGGGHTIDSIQILDSCTELSNPEGYFGLFGHTLNATIRGLSCNIVVRQIRITLSHPVQISNYRIGGIVGLAEETIVENCQTGGVLFTNLVHPYSGTGTYGAVGGIVGSAQGCRITNCTNSCEIYTQNYGGGIAGYVGSTKIKCCTNNGAVYGDNRDNNARSSVVVGGIVGGTEYRDTSCVQICYNSAIITANGISDQTILIQAGGICANNANDATIEYCYNSGVINAVKSGPESKGQISGVAPYSLKSCYNVGKINAEGFYFIYGVGRRNAGIENSYYLNACMPNNVEVPQGGTDRTEVQMKSVSFPAMLNTDSTVYVMDEYGVNGGYPIFGTGNQTVSIMDVQHHQYKVCTFQDRVIAIKDADNQEVMIVNIFGQIVYKTNNYTNEMIRLDNPGIYIVRVGCVGMTKIYIN